MVYPIANLHKHLLSLCFREDKVASLNLGALGDEEEYVPKPKAKPGFSAFAAIEDEDGHFDGEDADGGLMVSLQMPFHTRNDLTSRISYRGQSRPT